MSDLELIVLTLWDGPVYWVSVISEKNYLNVYGGGCNRAEYITQGTRMTYLEFPGPVYSLKHLRCSQTLGWDESEKGSQVAGMSTHPGLPSLPCVPVGPLPRLLQRGCEERAVSELLGVERSSYIVILARSFRKRSCRLTTFFQKLLCNLTRPCLPW